jgi:hypothetical protein
VKKLVAGCTMRVGAPHARARVETATNADVRGDGPGAALLIICAEVA